MSTLPLVIRPSSTRAPAEAGAPAFASSSPGPVPAEASAEALADWIRREHGGVLASLREHGALLFRGFAVARAEDFERVALAIDPELGREYLGTSPRAGLTRHVFSASELPGWYPIPQHCEMTFVREPPRRLFFACLTPPRGKGGETPLADFRAVYDALDPAVRARFVERGLRIVRNYDGPRTRRRFDLWKLKRWDEMFQTTDRAVVETKCRAEGFEPRWLEDDRLRLTSTQPAIQRHPETGEPVWFNHVQVFHLGTAPAEYRRIFARHRDARSLLLWGLSRALVALKRRAPAESQSLHVTHEDGAEIAAADLEHVRDVIWRHLAVFRWAQGDVLAIDNRRVSHGRLPYRGERQIAVAWS